ncbi:MAG: phosphotransferase, partial [Gammaproteobacteria bacterium]|nr:phosphotransferase [Gammaproteobacteria bacterium]
MSEVFVDLSRSADRLAGLLKQVGLDPGAAPPRVETLTGGVSSLLLKVTLPSLTVCVKQALPRLRVEKEWCVPTERVFAEVAWLQRVEPLIPGHVPRVLGLDKTLKAFVMEYLPAEQYRNWKTELLAGTVSAPLAAEVGELLGRIHAATAADPDTAIAFDNDASFHALRLEPYLVETARQHPALRDHLQGLIDACGANRRALVHGDISPKNILSGSRGIVLLDAECASFGDPAFDLAFPLSHLLLKALHVGAVRAALTALTCGMLDAYTPYIDWE